MQKPSKADDGSKAVEITSGKPGKTSEAAQNTPAGLACLLHQHVSALSDGQRQLAAALSSELDTSAQQPAQPHQHDHSFSQQGVALRRTMPVTNGGSAMCSICCYVLLMHVLARC